jgi:hypothetical protein
MSGKDTLMEFVNNAADSLNASNQTLDEHFSDKAGWTPIKPVGMDARAFALSVLIDWVLETTLSVTANHNK